MVTALQEGRVWMADGATNAAAKRSLLQVRVRVALTQIQLNTTDRVLRKAGV
jgi:hypothetical protein